MARFGVIKGGRASEPNPRHTDGPMTDLLDYEIFTRVIKAGSLSAAARELHSTPAMISKRLTRLEDRLGVKLLHRTTRRLTPTEVGQSFYERVLAVLAAVADAEKPRRHRQRSTARPAARLVADVVRPAARGAPAEGRSSTPFPSCACWSTSTTSMWISPPAASMSPMRIGTLPDSALIARRLAANRRVLCASPRYIEQYGLPADLEDLDQHRQLAAEPQIAWRFDGPAGPVTYKPQSCLQTNSSELVREAVVTGLGIAFRSTWDVANELKLGTLRRVLPQYSGASDVNIYAVYAGRRLVPPKVRAFVDYFAGVFGPDLPYWDRDIGPLLERVANAR